MQIARRNFLGSVLGTVIGSKMEFVAKPSAQLLFSPKDPLSVFLLQDEEVKQLIKGTLLAGFDEHWNIQATDIESVKRILYPDYKAAVLQFKFKQVDASTAFRVYGCGIHWITDEHISGKNFPNTIHMNNGDRLHVTYQHCVEHLTPLQIRMLLKNNHYIDDGNTQHLLLNSERKFS